MKGMRYFIGLGEQCYGDYEEPIIRNSQVPHQLREFINDEDSIVLKYAKKAGCHVEHIYSPEVNEQLDIIKESHDDFIRTMGWMRRLLNENESLNKDILKLKNSKKIRMFDANENLIDDLEEENRILKNKIAEHKAYYDPIAKQQEIDRKTLTPKFDGIIEFIKEGLQYYKEGNIEKGNNSMELLISTLNRAVEINRSVK
jgi:hypothetical protein